MREEFCKPNVRFKHSSKLAINEIVTLFFAHGANICPPTVTYSVQTAAVPFPLLSANNVAQYKLPNNCPTTLRTWRGVPESETIIFTHHILRLSYEINKSSQLSTWANVLNTNFQISSLPSTCGRIEARHGREVFFAAKQRVLLQSSASTSFVKAS